MTHSIPDSSAVALGTELGTVLITGDYKFDQTPVDGPPADVSRLAELGREGVLLLCGDSTNVDRDGLLAVGVGRRPAPGGGLRPLRGADRGDELRLEHPPRAAGRRRRRRARPQGRAGRALDAQERRHRPQRSATSRSPTGMLVGPREIDDFPDERVVIISTGSQGEPLSALRRMAYRDHPQVELQERRHGRLLRHADPRQRARRQRDDRPPLPHRLRRDHPARRARPRLRARLRRGGQADAQPRQAALRDALPRRLQAPAPARPARRGRRRRPRRTSSRATTGCRWRSTSAARASAQREQAGHDLRRRRRDRRHGRRGAARPAHALRRRDLHRRRDDRRAGRQLGRRPRGDLPRRPVPRRGRRAASRRSARPSRHSLRRAAKEEIREVDLLQQVLHDDLAKLVYDRLKRRPMVLPVVVEV